MYLPERIEDPVEAVVSSVVEIAANRKLIVIITQ
jgi:hypothetical protein